MPTVSNNLVVVSNKIDDKTSFISVTKNNKTTSLKIDNSVLAYSDGNFAFQNYEGKTNFIQQLSQSESIFLATSTPRLGNATKKENITSFIGDINGSSFLQSNFPKNGINQNEPKNGLVIVEKHYPQNNVSSPYEGNSKNLSISSNYNEYRNPNKPVNSEVSFNILKNNGSSAKTSSFKYSTNNPLVPESSVLSIPTASWKDYTTTYKNNGTEINGENQYNGTQPKTESILNNISVTNDNNNLLPKNDITIISEDNKTFVDSDIGIIRNGDEISDRKITTKSQIKPQFTIDKEEITDNGSNYYGIVKSFNSGLDDSRIDPYNKDSLNDAKTQINFIPPSNGIRSEGVVNIIKKSDYYTKIAVKNNVFFDKNDDDIKTQEDATGTKFVNIGVGMIYAIRSADIVVNGDVNGNKNALFGIPIQFTPEINGESRSANWTSSTALTRTNEYFVWANTTSRSINFRTSYMVISTDDSTEPWFKGEINPIYNSDWGMYWTENNIINIIDKYRKLILPYEDKKSPPIVAIEFSTDLNNVFSDTAGTWSRWIVSDVNIDTRIEMGYTKNRNPRMYDISLSLKEMAPTWRSFQTHEHYK